MLNRNAENIAQLTMFILKRSPFSNIGSFLMIALYFGFAAAAIIFALFSLKPSTETRRF